MKKLLSFLLVIALLATMVLPAAAEAEETLAENVQVNPILYVKETQTRIADRYIYDEHGELAEIKQYLEYTWQYCPVDFMVFEEAYYDMLYCLPDAVYKATERKLILTYRDNQFEEPWEVGGTYTVTVGLFDEELLEQVWTQNLQVTVVAYEAPTLDLEVTNTNLTAVNFGGRIVRDGEIDQETGEEILSEEYIYYPWQEYCNIEVAVGEETWSVPATQLSTFILREGHFAGITEENAFFGFDDDQSAENPWKVGGTYDARCYVYSKEAEAEVWSVDLKVKLVEPEVDIQISEVVVDELLGSTYEDEEGNRYTVYEWTSVGVVDAVVDGIEYFGITLDQFEAILCNLYGKVAMHCQLVVDWDNKEDYFDPNNQWEYPWQVGDVYQCRIQLSTEDQWLFEDIVDVKLCETKIESVIANPTECYAHEGIVLDLLFQYKDGTTGPCKMYWEPLEPLPEEPGEYTITILVGDVFELDVSVTILPPPTSGKLGDNITWKYDATTNTITVSGTGNTYFHDITIEELSEEFYEFVYSWQDLLMYYMVESVVFEEGITGLTPELLIQAPFVESIQLPNSLKKMPFLFLGYNGSYKSEDSGFDKDLTGVQTFVVPQNITAWDEMSFFACWGVEDIYLPAGLTSVNLDNLVYFAWFREEVMGMDPVTTTIHFAGTEEQWNAIKLHIPEVTVEYSEMQSTGLTLEEAMAYLESFEIVFEDPADSYVEEEVEDEIVVENGTVTIPDSVVDIVEGEDVVIEIVLPTPDEGEGEEDSDNDDNQDAEGTEPAPAPKVESVVISAAIVEKIADANTNVQIKLPEVTVSFDADAFTSIGEQSEQKDVTIVAAEIKQEVLKEEQKKALEDKTVHVVLNLEARAGEEKITEFGGGKVTISVPFELPENANENDYVVAYVADDGTITNMPTVYADGVLSFETTHFSYYVVLENVAPSTGSNPSTGDVNVTVLALLMVVSAACLTLCVTKRRAF